MVRTRFAPSPTGFMHVGNLRTALYAYFLAKSRGGSFVLRIEDTDRERMVEGAEDAIFRTLKRAGITPDEGPGIGGEFGPYVQSERKEIYLKYAERLVEEGKAYYCFCTKERLERLKEDGFSGYDRHCRDLKEEEVKRLLSLGTPHVIRQKVPLSGTTTFKDEVFGEISIDNAEIEDQILLKADGYPTYNFANVIDDHLMNITHVVRGSEYLTSTPKYNLLYEALGWEIPKYVHLPLIMGKDEDGSVSKLSKRHGSVSFEGLLEEGYLDKAIVNAVSLLGFSPSENREILSMDEIIEDFDVQRISKSPAVFDFDKLLWFNAEYIKAMGEEEFLKSAMPYLREVFREEEKPWGILYSILRERIRKFNEIPGLLAFFKELPEYPADYFINKKSKTNLENSPLMLSAAIKELEALESWDLESLRECLMSLAQRLGVKNGTLLFPVRIAVSGTLVTPGGAMEILALLGREESLRRMRLGLAKF